VSNFAATAASLPARLTRTLELAYAVEGVVAARVWQWPGRVAVGVRGNGGSSPTDLLRRVEAAVAGLREPEEAWDFGILDDDTPAPEAGGISDDDAVSSLRRSLRSPF
jgi:hypothetical protein